MLQCPSETAPTPGTYTVGPGRDCLARYVRLRSTPDSGSSFTEFAEAEVGGLSARGSFRAKVFP
jgi:hypothetical protein